MMNTQDISSDLYSLSEEHNSIMNELESCMDNTVVYTAEVIRKVGNTMLAILKKSIAVIAKVLVKIYTFLGNSEKALKTLHESIEKQDTKKGVITTKELSDSDVTKIKNIFAGSAALFSKGEVTNSTLKDYEDFLDTGLKVNVFDFVDSEIKTLKKKGIFNRLRQILVTKWKPNIMKAKPDISILGEDSEDAAVYFAVGKKVHYVLVKDNKYVVKAKTIEGETRLAGSLSNSAIQKYVGYVSRYTSKSANMIKTYRRTFNKIESAAKTVARNSTEYDKDSYQTWQSIITASPKIQITLMLSVHRLVSDAVTLAGIYKKYHNV